MLRAVRIDYGLAILGNCLPLTIQQLTRSITSNRRRELNGLLLRLRPAVACSIQHQEFDGAL